MPRVPESGLIKLLLLAFSFRLDYQIQIASKLLVIMMDVNEAAREFLYRIELLGIDYSDKISNSSIITLGFVLRVQDMPCLHNELLNGDTK
ncbi:hypothetical protein VNO77_44863 [Canavalia gladiata]|uniref:Uncharacterized protein n=1 Tax=Canavalia gladiata TaxID=3824 RepID=A0AAN9PR38_CANGL